MLWRLLSVWATGTLLTLGLCWGRSIEEYEEYELTTPDYDYENATFEYYFFNNASINYELYEVLNGKGDEKEDGKSTETTRTTGTTGTASDVAHSAPIILLALSMQQLFHPL